MKTESHPIVICKKIYDIVYTEDEEKRHEVKTTQYFLPNIDFKSIVQALKVLLIILLLIAAFYFPDKIKEVAPTMTYVLEQLR